MVVFGIEIETKIMIRMIVFAVAIGMSVLAEIIEKVYEAHSWKKNKGAFAYGDPMIAEKMSGLSLIVMVGVLVSFIV